MLLEQQELFGAAPVRVVPRQPVAPAPVHGLRYYQKEAVSAIKAKLATNPSTLAVLATGLGKTQIFCALANETDGRVIMLADRDELVTQMQQRYEKMFNQPVGREQADSYARNQRIVVASFDTVRQPRRLERMVRMGFALAIADEAHCTVAKTRKQVLEALMTSGAKLLGVTATPDRGDGKGLVDIYKSVAYNMDIVQGIEQGWLCPVKSYAARLPQLDISNVGTAAGDLKTNELDAEMVKATEGIVQGLLQHYPTKRTILFFPGKRSAELAAARFNVLEPGSTCCLTDSTPDEDRKRIVRDIVAGRYKRFCNVLIASKGFDWPEAEVVVMGRPTKSRALYAQMAGRGTRTLPGVTDKFPAAEQASTRRAAIAASSKPACILMDFVGNAGKHELVGPEDLLGSSYTEKEREVAKKLTKQRGGEGDAQEALREARALLTAKAQSVTSRVKCELSELDPFSALGTSTWGLETSQEPPTLAQWDALLRAGFQKGQLARVTKRGAMRLLDALAVRRKRGKCTLKQRLFLLRNGITADMTKEQASEEIDRIIRGASQRVNRC
jgi:superfamily II DNA or RNA helicase